MNLFCYFIGVLFGIAAVCAYNRLKDDKKETPDTNAYDGRLIFDFVHILADTATVELTDWIDATTKDEVTLQVVVVEDRSGKNTVFYEK